MSWWSFLDTHDRFLQMVSYGISSLLVLLYPKLIGLQGFFITFYIFFKICFSFSPFFFSQFGSQSYPHFSNYPVLLDLDSPHTPRHCRPQLGSSNLAQGPILTTCQCHHCMYCTCVKLCCPGAPVSFHVSTWVKVKLCKWQVIDILFFIFYLLKKEQISAYNSYHYTRHHVTGRTGVWTYGQTQASNRRQEASILPEGFQ